MHGGRRSGLLAADACPARAVTGGKPGGGHILTKRSIKEGETSPAEALDGGRSRLRRRIGGLRLILAPGFEQGVLVGRSTLRVHRLQGGLDLPMLGTALGSHHALPVLPVSGG